MACIALALMADMRDVNLSRPSNFNIQVLIDYCHTQLIKLSHSVLNRN